MTSSNAATPEANSIPCSLGKRERLGFKFVIFLLVAFHFVISYREWNLFYYTFKSIVFPEFLLWLSGLRTGVHEDAGPVPGLTQSV